MAGCRDFVVFVLQVSPFRPIQDRIDMTDRLWQALVLASILLTTPSFAQIDYPDRDKPDIDLCALMSGNCSTLKIAGRDFACRAVAYFHSEKGRASFTIALDDPNDRAHIVAFSGEYSRRPNEDLYILAVDRMELNSKDRP